MEKFNNCDVFVVGSKLYDNKSKINETILDKTTNSLLITRTATSTNGVNCDNWFSITEKKFLDTFEFIK